MAEAIAVALIATGADAAIVAGFAISGSAALINTGLVIGASAAYSAQQSSAARRKARNQFNDNLRDREVMIRSGVAPRRIIYGRDRVSGPVVYAESTGAKKEFLHLVIALAGHECEAIESIYFNDVLLPTPDGSGYINSGEFYDQKEESRVSATLTANGSGVCTLAEAASAVHGVFTVSYDSGNDVYSSVRVSYSHTPGSTQVTGLVAGAQYSFDYSRLGGGAQVVRIKKYLGTSSQTADADLVAESAGKWTSAHRGRGICYLYVRLKYDQDVFGQIGIPNISCVVKGKKVYDPRSGLTVWSDNAALCVADFLRDATFGLGATSAQVPAAELSTAANLCDEVVALDGIGGTQLRYTMNGSFTADVSPLDVLTALSTSMAGAAVWTQGRWYVRPGAYRTATLTISEDSLADGAIVTAPKAPRTELFNAVRVTFRDPSRDYSEVQAPLVANATYQTADGGVQIVRDIKLPFACDPMRAQRLGKIELERNRQALTLKLNANLKAYDLAPTDTAAVTLARYGWSSKAFEVVERTWNGGTLEYVLRETAAGVFDWAYGEATTVDLAPDTNLPNPYTAPAALTGLTVASGTAHLARNVDGTIMTRALVSWTQSTEQFVVSGGRIEVEWKRGLDALWTGSAPLSGDAVSTYLWPMRDGDAINVRVRPVNERGRAGGWLYAVHDVVGKTAPPSDVAGLTATKVTNGVRIDWTACPDVDYDETELRRGGTGWTDASPLVGSVSMGISGNSYLWIPAAGTYTLRAKHVDTSGNYSTNAASASVTVSSADLLEWADVSGRPMMFRATSRGWADVNAPFQGESWYWGGLSNGETGAVIHENQTNAGFWMVTKILRSTGAVTFVGRYYLSVSGAAMAAALNAIGSDYVVVVTTCDEPRDNRTADGADAALYRCGASRSVFGSPAFQFRSAYVLVGIGGCGEGNGYEAYNGQVSSDTNAWCDVSFYLQNGNLVISGTTATPRTLADYSYTGALNATYGATWSSNLSGQPADSALLNSYVGGNMFWPVETFYAYPGSYGGSGKNFRSGGLDLGGYGFLPGEQVTLSADMWCDSPCLAAGQYATLFIYTSPVSGAWNSSPYGGQINGDTTTRTRKSVTITCPSDADMYVLAVGIFHQGTNASTSPAGTCYADRIQVERGAVATAYTPALHWGSVNTKELGAGAATYLTSDSDTTVTTTLGAGAGGSQTPVEFYWENTLGFDATVEVSGAANFTITNTNGTGSTRVDRARLTIQEQQYSGSWTFVAERGESNYEEPVPVIAASGVARFLHARSQQVVVPAGRRIWVAVDVQVTNLSGGACSIVSRDPWVTAAVIKR